MKDVNDAIDKFCEIVLTENDFIEHSLADTYISKLDTVIADINKIKTPAKDQEIRARILNNVIRYLRIYQDEKVDGGLRMPPFSFDNSDNYKKYKEYFEKKYMEKYNNVDIPELFNFAFDYIQEISEHYRIFNAFSDAHDTETKETTYAKMTDLAKRMVDDVAENKVNDAVSKKVAKVVEDATREARINAEVAVKRAEKASSEVKETAKNAVENAVNNKMAEITQQISVTSVTILGIFAGIVLAVVGGMFYSSSVMENLYHTNLDKLICIAALVGFIFFNLIVILFRYVERIRNSDRVLEINDTQEGIKRFSAWIKHHKIDILVVLVNIALICLLFFSYGKVNENDSAPQDTESTECVFRDEIK